MRCVCGSVFVAMFSFDIIGRLCSVFVAMLSLDIIGRLDVFVAMLIGRLAYLCLFGHVIS